MRKVLIAGCAALFLSIAGLAQTAQTPSPAPLSQEVLEAILGQPAVTGEQTLPQTAEPFLAAAKRPLPLKATCTATCYLSGTISCTGSTCSAVNGSSCSAKGHVTCGGTTHTCSNCYLNCRCGGNTDAFCRANC
jgi:hypothetical protein